MALIFIVGIIFLIIGFCLQSQGKSAEKRLGVPVRQIVSADVGIPIPLKPGTGLKRKTLFSRQYRVSGTIDYLTDVRGALVPIEYKSAPVRRPRDSDIWQLLTYCFLIEEEGYVVNRGILHYPTLQKPIPYGPQQRQAVIDLVAQIRKAEKMPLQAIPGKYDHRCRRCDCRTICQ